MNFAGYTYLWPYGLKEETCFDSLYADDDRMRADVTGKNEKAG